MIFTLDERSGNELWVSRYDIRGSVSDQGGEASATTDLKQKAFRRRDIRSVEISDAHKKTEKQ